MRMKVGAHRVHAGAGGVEHRSILGLVGFATRDVATIASEVVHQPSDFIGSIVMQHVTRIFDNYALHIPKRCFPNLDFFERCIAIGADVTQNVSLRRLHP